MGTNKQTQAEDTAQKRIIKELIEIEQFAGDNFDCHIKAVDSLFYMYIQNCVHKGEEILISQDEIYNVYEVKKILELLGKYLEEL